MFEKVIDPVWQDYDPESKGCITQQQFSELAKYALEKAGHADKFNQEFFGQLCQQMAPVSEQNPEGNLLKRDVASMLNTVVFGGL